VNHVTGSSTPTIKQLIGARFLAEGLLPRWSGSGNALDGKDPAPGPLVAIAVDELRPVFVARASSAGVDCGGLYSDFPTIRVTPL